MPRFYFDICDGDGHVPDEEGTELTDFRAAQVEAVWSLADITKDLGSEPFSHSTMIEVLDAQRTPVMTAALTIAITKRTN